MDPNNKYTTMQQQQYDNEASHWSLEYRDPVVGSFDQHNNWQDYDDYLFKDVNTNNKVALEFGCGPGRNIVKFNSKFQRIDGVDISSINLEKAKVWAEHNQLANIPHLFKNNGVDLAGIDSNSYDVVFSTICLQHICVHEIRVNLMTEFHRVLKSGGNLCFQMGFGPGHPRSVEYFENNYEAQHTNSGCDTRVESPLDLEQDLKKIGFANIQHDIRPVGPGDMHYNWIFVRTQKL